MRPHRLPRSLFAALGCALAGCVIGAPPGFSAGDSWTLPLVDPLADGRLVTPVMIDGKGPFLFALDPDARVTTADQALAGIAGVAAKAGPRLTDEQDTTHPTWRMQVPNVTIGTLSLSLQRLALVENHHFDADGRRIWGVLGRDVIADSLVYTVDRDRGVVRLTVNDKFVPPAPAQILPYHKLVSRSASEGAQPVGADLDGGPTPASTRYLMTADVDGARVDLHLDLGDVPSQLAPRHWAAAKLAPTAWTQDLVDEVGTHRIVTQDGIAARVAVPAAAGAVVREGIGFVAYDDRRWIWGQIDGTLGLDFFRPYVVSADWHHERFYLSPRDTTPAATADRLARWGANALAGCKVTGCGTATVTRDAPPAPAELGMAEQPRAAAARATLHVERDPALAGRDLELVFAAVSETGAPLPAVYVDLGATATTLDAPIEPRYAHATLTVADLSPYPRACADHAPACARLAPPLVP